MFHGFFARTSPTCADWIHSSYPKLFGALQDVVQMLRDFVDHRGLELDPETLHRRRRRTACLRRDTKTWHVCVCVGLQQMNYNELFFANTSWAISTDYNLQFKEVSHAIKCINKCNGQRHCRSILFLEAFKATHARCDDAKVLQCEQCLWRVTWRLLKGELHGFALTIPYHCDSLQNVHSFLITVYNDFESII